jgi:hypothetical protein
MSTTRSQTRVGAHRRARSGGTPISQARADARPAVLSSLVGRDRQSGVPSGCKTCVFNVDDAVCANAGYPRHCPAAGSPPQPY